MVNASIPTAEHAITVATPLNAIGCAQYRKAPWWSLGHQTTPPPLMTGPSPERAITAAQAGLLHYTVFSPGALPGKKKQLSPTRPPVQMRFEHVWMTPQ